MTDIVLTPVTTGYNISNINANFVKIQNKFNDETVLSTGGNNTMSQALDMNGHAILNLSTDFLNESSLVTVAALTAETTARIASDIAETNARVLGDQNQKAYTDLVAANFASGLGNFAQAGTGSVPRTFQDKLRESVSLKDFGAVGNGVIDDTAAVQLAVNYAASVGASIWVPVGTYMISAITLLSNTHIMGASPYSSVFKQRSAGISMFNEKTSANKTNISFESVGLDVDNKDSGIFLTNITNLYVRNCYFKNMHAWGIAVGIDDARANGILQTSSNIVITDCHFYNSLVTYECILLFNCSNAIVRSCYFHNDSNTTGIGVGLYQNTTNVTIDSCRFYNLTTGSYYSLSTYDTKYSKCNFEACVNGIQGANESDHGSFGITQVFNLKVTDCYFTKNTGEALQLGAVNFAQVTNCTFDSNTQNALLINKGNATIVADQAQSINMSFTGCHFLNNNTSGTSPSFHASVLFYNVGGTFNATFTNCTWGDTQITKTQLYPITFDGAFTFSQIHFFGCAISAYGAGQSVNLTSGAVASDVKMYGCNNLTALPSGVTVAI